MTGLTFLLHGGQFLKIALPHQTAQSILQDWSSGKYQEKDIRNIVGRESANENNISWVVSVKEIQAIHLENIQQQKIHPYYQRSGN